MELKNKEIRCVELRNESTEEHPRRVTGVAVVFDTPTVLYKDSNGVEYKEVIDRHALDNADMSDTPFRYQHAGAVLARVRGNSMVLDVRDDGLHVTADLLDTTQARDCYELIRSGAVDKMSFAFTVKEDDYDYKTHTRTIKAIEKLYDVSAVDYPAYDATSIAARSYFDDKEAEFKKLEEEQRAIAELTEAKAKLLKLLEVK